MSEEIVSSATFLEMDTPPQSYPAAPAGRDASIAKTQGMPPHFYRYLMDRVGWKYHWVTPLRLSNDEITAFLASSARDVRVLYVDGVPGGFFELRFNLPESVKIAYFGLMDHLQGQGFGRWFLGEAVKAAWAYGPRKVTLQTSEQDHGIALPLYQQFGFGIVGRQPETIRPMSFEERAACVLQP